jgi:hypothetical protein
MMTAKHTRRMTETMEELFLVLFILVCLFMFEVGVSFSHCINDNVLLMYVTPQQ